MTVTVQTPEEKADAVAAGGRWRIWALTAICVAAGLLYAWRVGAGHMGNTYYSAAVKSMTGSLSNFLFGSYDPYGVFTVDKPPMSLWPQAISVLVFGYHWWALLLPEVLAGVAAVFLLHRTVRLWAGENVALLAALIMAVTPITVVINQDNNPDTLLVLWLVAAAYAVTRSIQAATSRDRTKWLLWCAFFVGCGFLTKMLQAWIIVPALVLAFLVGVSGPLRRRLLDLVGAGVVLVVSSFWWVALHDWWPGNKPYMGGSKDGSAWDLVFGYNGFGRIFGVSGGGGGGMVTFQNGEMVTSSFGGDPGIGRMFNDMNGGQISWLLPLSLLVLVAVSVLGANADRAGWFLWGGWLLVTTVVFSFAKGIFHPYYTTAMTPAVAAICAAGLAQLWRYRDSVAWVLLPLGVAISVAWAFVLVSRDTSWHGWVRWVALTVAVVAVGGLVLGRVRRSVGRPALVAGIVALLLTPGVWSVAAAVEGYADGNTPAAGPLAFTPNPSQGPVNIAGGPTQQPPPGSGSGQGPGAGQGSGPGQGSGSGPGQPNVVVGGGSGGITLTDEQRRILDYAVKHGTEIALAVNGSASTVAPYIMDSDATVIAMGGFSGQDDSPSVEQLQQWLDDGTLRFVLSSQGGRSSLLPKPPGRDVAEERQRWIQRHCTVVDPSVYGGRSKTGQTQTIGGADTLYRCGR